MDFRLIREDVSMKSRLNATINDLSVTVFPLLDWISAFLTDCLSRGLSQNTIRFYQEKLDMFVGFCRKNNLHDIQDISTHDLRNYFIGLQINHSQGGVHAFFRAVRAFLNWYEDENEFTDWKNPIRKVTIKAPNLPPLDPADINAIKAILKTCKNDFIGIRDKTIYLMLLDTGIRASELLSLDHENVNPISGVVQILHGKGGKFRTAYLSKKSRLALRKFISIQGKSEGALFTSEEGIRLKYGALHTNLRRRCIRANVPNQTAHSFRRLFALTMLRNGVDIFSLQMLMGHADLQVMRRYLKLASSDLWEAHTKASPVNKLFA